MTSELDKLGKVIAQGTISGEENAQRMSTPGTIHTRFNFNKYAINVRNTKTIIEENGVGNLLVWDQDKWDEENWSPADLNEVPDNLNTTTYKNISKTTATWTGNGSITF